MQSRTQLSGLKSVVLLCALLGLFGLSLPGAQRSLAGAFEPTATPSAYLYLPAVYGAGTPVPPGPRSVDIPAAATWRLFSTGNGYAEALAGANVLVDGPGYPFAEVGQYHTHWDQYYVEKGFLAFDTGALPASAAIVSATLVISGCTSVQADRSFQVEFYPASAGENVTAADWSAYNGSVVSSFPSTSCGHGAFSLPVDPQNVRPGGALRLAVITDRIRLAQEPARDQGDTVQIPTAHDAVRLQVRYEER
jgi:hypothetical protein